MHPYPLCRYQNIDDEHLKPCEELDGFEVIEEDFLKEERYKTANVAKSLFDFFNLIKNFRLKIIFFPVNLDPNAQFAGKSKMIQRVLALSATPRTSWWMLLLISLPLLTTAATSAYY